jgi:hypothetical protein
MSIVAFLDILGFKELVEKNDHKSLTGIYTTLVGINLAGLSGNNIKKDVSGGSKIDTQKISVNARMISDSIVLWTEDNSISSFIQIITAVRTLLKNSLVIGLPFRGAISHGEVGGITSKPITPFFKCDALFGKGIVNAYSLEGGQDWMGCIIDDTCFSLYNEIKVDVEGNALLIPDFLTHIGYSIRYDVPIKNGKTYNAYVINWVSGNPDTYTEAYIRSKFAEKNKDISSIQVQTKIENTITFVNYIKNL